MTAGTLPRFLPGMFISIAIQLVGAARVRPYTIASNPEDGEPFEICFNRVPGGLGAAWLFDRVIGDELSFTGPFGAFTLERPPAAETILIAEGTAIAPIRPILRRALIGRLAEPQTSSEQQTVRPESGTRSPIKLLYATDRPEHLLYASEFERLAAAHNNLDYEPIIVGGHDLVALDPRLSERSSGTPLNPQARVEANPIAVFTEAPSEANRDALYKRLLEEANRRWVEADADRSRHFYICGVGKGVLALRDRLRAAGYERRAVKYEQW
jgi:ferredoxin-NADP reductase